MATTYYVGTGTGDFATINDAIAAASEGDIIIVKGSEYTETDEKIVINTVCIIRESHINTDSITVCAGNSVVGNSHGSQVVFYTDVNSIFGAVFSTVTDNSTTGNGN